MTNDTWQMLQAFFVLFVSAGGIIAYGIALGRKESPKALEGEILDRRLVLARGVLGLSEIPVIDPRRIQA